MNSEPLFLPRLLAIQLLSRAQNLPAGEGIHAVVGDQNGEPVSIHFTAGSDPSSVQLPPGEGTWAWVQPQASQAPITAVPAGAARLLTVALDTKGVLQLRCWEAAAGKPVERTLKIRD